MTEKVALGSTKSTETLSSSSPRFEFTRDESLIREFIDMRQALYSADPRFIGFREFHRETVESYTLPYHHTLLIWDGPRCIGGGRLTLVLKGADLPLLPLEQDFMDERGNPTIRLRDVIKEPNLREHSFVEASRMIVHPDYRHEPNYVVNMFGMLLRHAQQLNAKYFFAMTDLLRLRLYKKIASVHLGLVGKNMGIDLPERPTFEGIRMGLLMWDIQPEQNKHDERC